MRKGYKFKLEPTKEQAVLINKTLGCCRWVYNNALDKKSKAYARRKEKISCTTLKNRLPYLKQVKPWLAEVDSTALQQAIMHMDDAYANFFAGRANYPQFKSKHNEVHSYKTVSTSLRIEDDKHVNLPILGVVRCRMHRQPQGVIKMMSGKENPTDMEKMLIDLCDYNKSEMSKDQIDKLVVFVKNLK